MKRFREMMYGLLVGDALGVPYEFKDREQMDKRPCIDMIGHGTHDQPKGTWSDDSSMALCIVESINEGYDDKKVAEKFVRWMNEGYMTPHGVCFDIGSTTRQSLWKMQNQLALNDPKEIEETIERCYNHNDPRLSGNGALMRILPFLVHLNSKNISYSDMFKEVRRHCHLTHQSLRSTYACFLLLVFAERISKGDYHGNKIDKHEAWSMATNTVISHMDYFEYTFEDKQIEEYWDKILNGDIKGMPRKDIPSSGYVMDTLLASVWCVLTSNNYKEVVLKAVNLGDDTDTTGAVTGGLAGLIWGANSSEGIPKEWIENLVRLEDVNYLIDGVYNDLTARQGLVELEQYYKKEDQKWKDIKESIKTLIDPQCIVFVEDMDTYKSEGFVEIEIIDNKLLRQKNCRIKKGNQKVLGLFTHHVISLETIEGDSEHEGADIEYFVQEQRGYEVDDFYGYLIFPLKDGRFWLVSYSC